MFYFLPEKEKKELTREYLLRLSIVALSFSCVAIFLGSVFLLPSYVISDKKFEEVSFRNKQLTATLESGGKSGFNEALAAAKKDMKLLAVTNEMPMIDFIAKITKRKSEDVSIKTIQFVRKVEGGSEIQVVGNSATRDALISFEKELAKEPLFSSVDFPVSNLAKSKDIDFSIKIISTY
jgi:hypothetical protein